jgi:putative transposase
MAVRRRYPEPGLLHHSDRGCTYTCEDYRPYLASRGITCSIRRWADCYVNAAMEADRQRRGGRALPELG